MAFSPKIDNNLQQDSLRVILFRFYGIFDIVSSDKQTKNNKDKQQ